MSAIPVGAVEVAKSRGEWRTVLRHLLPLRVRHWINMLCMVVLGGSSLQEFNAHPALMW